MSKTETTLKPVDEAATKLASEIVLAMRQNSDSEVVKVRYIADTLREFGRKIIEEAVDRAPMIPHG